MISSINRVLSQDKRISALVSEIKGDVLIDVGCDHGYVTVGALSEGKISRAVAVDISEASLSKTTALSIEAGVAPLVTAVCADGLAPISEDVDVGVVAGIGGYEIIEILSAAPRLPDRLILCPHQNAAELRHYLDGKFKIEKDYIVAYGGKFYPIIVLSAGNDNYYPGEFLFGKNLPESEDYRQMLAARKRVLDERFCNHNVPDGKLRKEYEEVTSLCSRLKI